jgi:hypothetical protein
MISMGCSRCKERLIFSRHILIACNIFVVNVADYESPGTSLNSNVLCRIHTIPSSLSFTLPD